MIADQLYSFIATHTRWLGWNLVFFIVGSYIMCVEAAIVFCLYYLLFCFCFCHFDTREAEFLFLLKLMYAHIDTHAHLMARWYLLTFTIQNSTFDECICTRCTVWSIYCASVPFNFLPSSFRTINFLCWDFNLCLYSLHWSIHLCAPVVHCICE